MPAISVIVPTRLRNHLLPRAVRSILAQTFSDFEIIVVDDNPPDKRVSTDPALVELLNHPKVRVLTDNKPRNASTARNLALQAVQGEWITYLDDDDAYQPMKLEKQFRRAMESGCILGLCGVTYHLARRCRTRIFTGEEIARGGLLLLPVALPTLFHKKSEVLFDEELSAGEDAYYFYHLVDQLKVERIFNVAESLVDVYPQPGPRVNANAEGLWIGFRAIYRDFGSKYDAKAAKIFLKRAELGYLKFQKGNMAAMIKAAWDLLRLGGTGERRFVLNALLFRVPFLRRFVVS